MYIAFESSQPRVLNTPGVFSMSVADFYNSLPMHYKVRSGTYGGEVWAMTDGCEFSRTVRGAAWAHLQRLFAAKGE